jgi:hypothetical protein
MSFTYEPLTEEQCNKEKQFKLLEPGIYNFQVFGSEFKHSKTNNPMIVLKLLIWDNDGKEHTLYDYLVSTPNMMWKTLHFCKAVGLEKEYLDMKFNENLCINKSGKASVNYQVGKKKEDGTFYPDKNGIEDYIFDENTVSKEKSKEDNFFNDAVPF